MKRQLDLFSPPEAELDLSDDRLLMQRVPGHVRFGTSSWTFPGWAGLVYRGNPTEKELARNGLEAYARHPLFRTVGIDRSYYRPLEAETLERYARQLPSGFRCVIKMFSELTSRRRPRSGEPNPGFLSGALFDEVFEPLERCFRPHLGPLIFEFPPSTGQLLTPEEFAGQLSGFLRGLPRSYSFGVELRNARLLTPAYLDVLGTHGVAHVLNFWEAMPTLGVQLDLPGVLNAEFAVCRLLIPPGQRYEARKASLAPFDRIADVQEGMRADVARLIERCEALGKVVYVIVNNKAEGSSPLTVRALAERVAHPNP